MDKLQTEIEAIYSQIEELRRERQQLSNAAIAPLGIRPKRSPMLTAVTPGKQHKCRQKSRGLMMRSCLSAQLSQKKQQSVNLQRSSPMEQQVEEGRALAHGHAERINELAAELAAEVKGLKAIADQISPSYWQVYYKPFITGFKSISVPYVRSDGDVWTIVNRVV